ncbi:MAG: bifunctional enoyl-CoA hydratase/phosphate acetyltransferase [Neisseria sp.]|nr:bifunctional enoyl-CoA hydratase/phosphate acetyltransferase [Neisseria sp.]
MRIADCGELESRARALPAVRCAVVHPCDAGSLDGAMLAAQTGLIEPIVYAPRAKFEALAEAEQRDVSAWTIIDVAHSHAAAQAAAQAAAAGEVEVVMKGSLHTDELLRALLAERGLRTARRMSHVYYFDIPAYHKPLLLSDCALNIAPKLPEKADIVQNAVDLAHLLGCATPKVAVLAAVETVNPDMPSTLDAAALCKMADRGQIRGALLDGPLAFDNAISKEAAAIKKITSPVAGDADVLLVPDLEAGNMLGKQLEYFANAQLAGIVCGARVPVILTSRADHAPVRRLSALLAKLMAHHYRVSPP